MSFGPSRGAFGHGFFKCGHGLRIILTRLFEMRGTLSLVFRGEVSRRAVFESSQFTREKWIDRIMEPDRVLDEPGSGGRERDCGKEQTVSENRGEWDALTQALDTEHYAGAQKPYPGRILD